MPCHTLTVAAGNMSTCADEWVDETDVFMRSRRRGRADSADGTAAGTVSCERGSTKEATASGADTGGKPSGGVGPHAILT